MDTVISQNFWDDESILVWKIYPFPVLWGKYKGLIPCIREVGGGKDLLLVYLFSIPIVTSCWCSTQDDIDF